MKNFIRSKWKTKLFISDMILDYFISLKNHQHTYIFDPFDYVKYLFNILKLIIDKNRKIFKLK